MHWHPIFAHLLRPLVEAYYEVQTDVPVGDLPRQADIVLLRRKAPAPFVGIWGHLTPWNILEFKGPTVDARLRDLDLLLEVGLGIDRRLNEERQLQGLPWLTRSEVSWWYLANHVGSRFRAEAERLLGNTLQPLQDGVWHCQAVGHVLLLVSRDQLAVDRESVPLHLVTQEPVERELLLAREVVQQPGCWDMYGSWLAYLHPNLWEEVQRMIRTTGIEPTLDLKPLIDIVGLKQFIDQVGLKQVIDQVGLKQVIDQVGLKQVIDQVGPKQVIDQVSLKQVIDQLGLKQVIDQVGLKQVLEVVGPEQVITELLSQLTPEQVQELKRRLP
jgi:hypothetical protein